MFVCVYVCVNVNCFLEKGGRLSCKFIGGMSVCFVGFLADNSYTEVRRDQVYPSHPATSQMQQLEQHAGLRYGEFRRPKQSVSVDCTIVLISTLESTLDRGVRRCRTVGFPRTRGVQPHSLGHSCLHVRWSMHS